MSAESVKRSQYFSPPTTECPHSSRNHFEDWEEFHLPMARMHHAALHGRGVASGLEVRVEEAGSQIEVGPGVAVDGRGELIALAGEGQADVGAERPGEAGQQADQRVRLRHAPLAQPGARHVLALNAYGEVIDPLRIGEHQQREVGAVEPVDRGGVHAGLDAA